jgi:hypothetical protein
LELGKNKKDEYLINYQNKMELLSEQFKKMTTLNIENRKKILDTYYPTLEKYIIFILNYRVEKITVYHIILNIEELYHDNNGFTVFYYENEEIFNGNEPTPFDLDYLIIKLKLYLKSQGFILYNMSDYELEISWK